MLSREALGARHNLPKHMKSGGLDGKKTHFFEKKLTNLFAIFFDKDILLLSDR
jgi:hypothetical protein